MNASRENLRWIRPALQKRSQASFDRILNAAESLLRDRSFDQLTISDVVRQAESSVGAFYTRFSNKDALLDALYQRFQNQAIATMERHLAPEQWESASVEQIVTQIVGFAVRFHRRHRGLLRALVLRGYQNPDWRYKDSKSRRQLSVTRVGALMKTRQSEINHPDAALAGSLGFLSVLAVLREKILFGDSTASALRITAGQLEEELVRLYLAYLGVLRTSSRQDSRKATGRPASQSSFRKKPKR
jgi:AcrR family transcriptional regulator